MKTPVLSFSSLFLTGGMLLQLIKAAEIRVGGTQGWTLGVTYDNITASAGDVLIFDYPKNFHDVWRLSEATCDDLNVLNEGYNVGNPQQAPVSYILEEPGVFHFACLIPGHCGSGMLVTVIVSGNGSQNSKDTGTPGNINTSLSQDLQNQQNPGNCSDPIDNEDGSFTVICQTAPIPMAPGDEINANLLVSIPYPEDHVVLVNQSADLIDETGRSVPLSDVYVHHVFSFYTNSLPFTEGAEFRGIPFVSDTIPKPYARVVDGAQLLSNRYQQYVNFHLINTIGIEDDHEVKQCIECWCPGSNPPTGRMSCCKTCNSTARADEGPMNYYINYNVTYMPLTHTILPSGAVEYYDVDGEQRIPLDAVFLDMTGTRVEHDVHAQGANKLDVIARVYEFYPDCPEVKQFGLVTCQSHQHIGGDCIRAFVHDTNELVCESCAVYGTEDGEPGNEGGYLVGVNMTVHDPPLIMDAGTKIRVESVYKADQDYLGVMSLLWVWTFPVNYSVPEGCGQVGEYAGEPVDASSIGIAGR